MDVSQTALMEQLNRGVKPKPTEFRDNITDRGIAAHRVTVNWWESYGLVVAWLRVHGWKGVGFSFTPPEGGEELTNYEDGFRWCTSVNQDHLPVDKRKPVKGLRFNIVKCHADTFIKCNDFLAKYPDYKDKDGRTFWVMVKEDSRHHAWLSVSTKEKYEAARESFESYIDAVIKEHTKPLTNAKTDIEGTAKWVEENVSEDEHSDVEPPMESDDEFEAEVQVELKKLLDNVSR